MKNRAGALIIGVVFLIFIVLIGYLLISCFYLIPNKMESMIGPSAEYLDSGQKYIYMMRLFFKMEEILSPLQLENSFEVFEISEGESPSQIADRLGEVDYIADKAAFIDLLIYTGVDRKIQPGIYRIASGMNTVDITLMLMDPNPEDVAFSFLAGWRWEEIAALLPDSGLAISKKDFGEAVNKIEAPLQDSQSNPIRVEGFLFPGDYILPRSSTADEVVTAFVEGFLKDTPDDFESLAAAQGLSVYEAVILASIVQKEMVNPLEAATIASVFFNRLMKEMPLQSDPTVQYALGYQAIDNTWWKTSLTSLDLEFDSPFNTYVNDGLPPAPICNPGVEALLAVVKPEVTNYYYFRASCKEPGIHVFSETYEEHVLNKCE
jgi:UPF0755 protein